MHCSFQQDCRVLVAAIQLFIFQIICQVNYDSYMRVISSIILPMKPMTEVEEVDSERVVHRLHDIHQPRLATLG